MHFVSLEPAERLDGQLASLVPVGSSLRATDDDVLASLKASNGIDLGDRGVASFDRTVRARYSLRRVDRDRKGLWWVHGCSHSQPSLAALLYHRDGNQAENLQEMTMSQFSIVNESTEDTFASTDNLQDTICQVTKDDGTRGCVSETLLGPSYRRFPAAMLRSEQVTGFSRRNSCVERRFWRSRHLPHGEKVIR
jgi:hypothetical protein